MYLSTAAGDDPITEADFDYLQAQVYATFGGNPYDPDTRDFINCRNVFDRCMDERWGRAEYRNRVKLFVTSHKFAEWRPADFFGRADRPALYDYPWAVARWTEDRGNKDRIGCYLVEMGDAEPVRLFGWRHECDGKLPEHKATFPPHMSGDRGEPMTGETWEKLQQLKASLGTVEQCEKEERKVTTHDAAMAEANLVVELVALRGWVTAAAKVMAKQLPKNPDARRLVDRAREFGLLAETPRA